MGRVCDDSSDDGVTVERLKIKQTEKMRVKTIIYSYILTRISKLKIKQKKIVGENVEQSELILISF